LTLNRWACLIPQMLETPNRPTMRPDTATASVADVLNRAAYLLSKPGAWCRRDAAQTKTGYSVEVNDPQATCWCAGGAIHRVAGPDTLPALDAFEAYVDKHLGWSYGFMKWNDVPARSQKEVVKALRAAALV
jgi:hypothetical protein